MVERISSQPSTSNRMPQAFLPVEGTEVGASLSIDLWWSYPVKRLEAWKQVRLRMSGEARREADEAGTGVE